MTNNIEIKFGKKKTIVLLGSTGIFDFGKVTGINSDKENCLEGCKDVRFMYENPRELQKNIKELERFVETIEANGYLMEPGSEAAGYKSVYDIEFQEDQDIRMDF